MKNILTYSILMLLIPVASLAQEKGEDINHSTNILKGEWIIDLRPSPASAEYLQAFVIKSVKENTLEGTFYGSDLENAILNKNWDKLYFAFTTRDQSNEYYHSGYLFNGKLYGISYCPNRDFAAPWTGMKKYE